MYCTVCFCIISSLYLTVILLYFLCTLTYCTNVLYYLQLAEVPGVDRGILEFWIIPPGYNEGFPKISLANLVQLFGKL